MYALYSAKLAKKTDITQDSKKRIIFARIKNIYKMNFLTRIKEITKITINLNGYIDTESAEKSIRGNIYFRGPNAWILAFATIIASVGLG